MQMERFSVPSFVIKPQVVDFGVKIASALVNSSAIGQPIKAKTSLFLVHNAC